MGADAFERYIEEIDKAHVRGMRQKLHVGRRVEFFLEMLMRVE
jgi:hypothetical protein